MTDNYNTYAGTSGYVNQPASLARATTEAASGVSTERARLVLQALCNFPSGFTWRQLAESLNLHHGQISGALSNLHKSGHVFMLRQQRNKCHPYVHIMYRDVYAPEQRIDEPVKTKSNQRLTDLEELLDTLTTMIGFGRITDPELIAHINTLNHTA
jgi:predicted transcriptional regulator